ncbi:hypothetical protein ACQQ2N_14100 [Dokdonella sp. MW10]|uniref:hypothetical protein n=1 Tax=Dokdonella sp. MW10 TaxID=2992926 RepID=UPI003F8112A1
MSKTAVLVPFPIGRLDDEELELRAWEAFIEYGRESAPYRRLLAEIRRRTGGPGEARFPMRPTSPARVTHLLDFTARLRALRKR